MLQVQELPSETVQQIFSYLSGGELFRCREVCRRWRTEVDGYVQTEAAWRRLCEHTLGSRASARQALQQARLPWRHLYASLALWPRMRAGNYQLTLLTSCSFRRVIVLPDGSLGVAANRRLSADPFECRYCDTIFYYNSDDLIEINRITLDFLFSSYIENEKLIVVIHEDRRICLILKSTMEHFFVGSVPMFLHVPNDVFTLLGNKVYYQADDGHAYVARLVNDDDNGRASVEITCLGCLPDDVISFTYHDKKLYCLSMAGNVYEVSDGKFHYAHSLNKFRANIAIELARYGFKWSDRVIARWIQRHFDENIKIGDEHGTFCSQGNLVLMGTGCGVIHFFYPPTLNSLRLHRSQSYFSIHLNKILNIQTPFEKILQLFVVEKFQGHKIIVFTAGRVMCLQVNSGPKYALDRVALTRLYPQPPKQQACMCLCHSGAVTEDPVRSLVLTANARTPETIEAMVTGAPPRIFNDQFVVHALHSALRQAITQTRREICHSLGKRAERRARRASERLAKRARLHAFQDDMAAAPRRASPRLAALAAKLDTE